MPITEETQTTRKTGFQSMVIIIMLIIGIGIIVLLQTRDGAFKTAGIDRLTKGSAAPDFTLPGLDGKMVSLSDQKGKVVFLNIWATWCPPCIEEMPSMEKLHRQLKGEDFEILAVSIDTKGADVVRPFMKKHKLTFTALTDAKETLKHKYQTTGVPETFIIDRNGIIAEKVIGPRDWASPEAIGFLRKIIQEN